MGMSANKFTKASVPVMADLARTIKVEKFHLGTIFINDWDKHDYDSVLAALKENPNLHSFLLNNMRV